MGLNVDTVRTGDSEDSRGGSNMIPVLSGDIESHCHITSQWRLERRKKEAGRQHGRTALAMVISKGKCWNTYWQDLYCFSLKAIFPFLLFWGVMETSSEKSFHPDPVINDVQGPWTWILLLLWPAALEHAQAFAPQHKSVDSWLLTHSCLGDIVLEKILGPQDTLFAGIHLFPRQSCPLSLSEHSAVFYLSTRTLIMTQEFSTNSVCIKCNISSEKAPSSICCYF